MTETYIIGISLACMVGLQIFLSLKRRGISSLSQVLSLAISLLSLFLAIDVLFFVFVTDPQIQSALEPRRVFAIILGQMSLLWISVTQIAQLFRDAE